MDDARARSRRELSGAVLGVVVGHDDLAADAVLGQRGAGPGDAALDVGGLVEARDHDADEQLVLRGEDFGLRKEKGLDDAHGVDTARIGR